MVTRPHVRLVSMEASMSRTSTATTTTSSSSSSSSSSSREGSELEVEFVLCIRRIITRYHGNRTSEIHIPEEVRTFRTSSFSQELSPIRPFKLLASFRINEDHDAFIFPHLRRRIICFVHDKAEGAIVAGNNQLKIVLGMEFLSFAIEFPGGEIYFEAFMENHIRLSWEQEERRAAPPPPPLGEEEEEEIAAWEEGVTAAPPRLCEEEEEAWEEEGAAEPANGHP